MSGSNFDTHNLGEERDMYMSVLKINLKSGLVLLALQSHHHSHFQIATSTENIIIKHL